MAYPDLPRFDSAEPGSAWWTDARTPGAPLICSGTGARLARDVQARLRELFDNATFELIARRPDGGVGPRSAIESTPAWRRDTLAYLWAALRQWYGAGDARTRALESAWRASALSLEALRVAVWLTYYTRGGRAADYNGDPSAESEAPRAEAALAAVQLKPGARLPALDARLPESEATSQTFVCQRAPARPSALPDATPQNSDPPPAAPAVTTRPRPSPPSGGGGQDAPSRSLFGNFLPQLVGGVALALGGIFAARIFYGAEKTARKVKEKVARPRRNPRGRARARR